MEKPLRLLFDTDGFVPRWDCGAWTPAHGWTHIISDIAIGLAYAAIPLALCFFVLKRKDAPFPPVFWLFGAFILACGSTHFIDASLFWHPWYRFSALAKVVTAVVSWATAIALIRYLPQALALPGLARVTENLAAEISERRRVEGELRRAMAFESAVLDAGLDGIISTDEEGRVVAWNRAAERIFGYWEQAAIGRTLEELIVPERSRTSHRAGLQRLRETGTGRILDRIVEVEALCADGSERTVELCIRRIGTEGAARFTAFIHDVTERKISERQRQAALAEAETLLKEVHHRVRNNMQIISSLLGLHAGKMPDPAQRVVLDDCRNRIQAMALIHELLYTGGQFACIEFNHYLAKMVRIVVESCAECAVVKLDIRGERMEVSLDTAVPLSLIASELVMNAVKHAFAGGRPGTLTIRLTPGEEMHELIVQDDGPGLPPDFGFGESPGVGLELIANLTRQVRGEFQFIGGEPGARAMVRWPARSDRPRPVAAPSI